MTIHVTAWIEMCDSTLATCDSHVAIRDGTSLVVHQKAKTDL